MEIKIDINNLIDILSISTAFMLGLLFLTSKSKNNKANIFLGLFLWSLTTEIVNTLLENTNYQKNNFIATGALTIPFLFLYIIKTINLKFKLVYLLLFFPFLLSLVNDFFFYLEYPLNIFILIFILNIIKKHQVKVGYYYSDINNKTLLWIKNIVYVYLFFHLLWIIEDLIGLKYENIPFYFAQISTILTLIMIYWIGYNGFSQPEIFNSILLIENREDNIENSFKEKTVDQFNELKTRISQEKLFLNVDLDLRILSKQLNIREKELSKLIKVHTQKNFYHFINKFRVEEFKNLLLTPKALKMSLVGLSFEAGFNSKSTFYSSFKLLENKTPKQFEDSLKKSE